MITLNKGVTMEGLICQVLLLIICIGAVIGLLILIREIIR